MRTPATLPSVPQLKAEARLLRRESEKQGQPISHSAALERIAHYYGFRDWNTLHARAARAPRLQTGARVQGRYLGQSFTGTVLSLDVSEPDSHQRITVQFDQPVDVVRFDSFSSWRQRVSATITPGGRSPQVTSDGEPHLVVGPLT